MPGCKSCIWYSDGFQDERGEGYCYVWDLYVDPVEDCPEWQESLREKPVPGPPARESMEIKRI